MVRLSPARELEFLFSHVTVDELGAVRDLDRPEALRSVLAEIGRHVSTGAVAWDVSKWGEARWSDDDQLIERLNVGNEKNTRDALPAATALAAAI